MQLLTTVGTCKKLPPLGGMWSAAVIVKLRSEQTLHVSTLHEALDCLHTRWPKEARNSLSFNRALVLCIEAVDGERSQAAARVAFIAAAREAGLLGASRPA
jgi:hypothetical protein